MDNKIMIYLYLLAPFIIVSLLLLWGFIVLLKDDKKNVIYWIEHSSNSNLKLVAYSTNGVERTISCNVNTTEMDVNILKMYNPKVFSDGDKWCCLSGRELQGGVITGVGKTPEESISNWFNFYHNYYANELPLN